MIVVECCTCDQKVAGTTLTTAPPPPPPRVVPFRLKQEILQIQAAKPHTTMTEKKMRTRPLVSFKQSVIELHINFFYTQKMKIFEYNYIVSCTVSAPIIYFKLSKHNELSSIVV